METLKDYITAVHARGFNISRLINKFKKDQREHKALYEIPDVIFIQVCKEYLVGREVKDDYPYFMKVLVLKSHEHNANRHVQEHVAYKKERMPQHIKDIFKNL